MNNKFYLAALIILVGGICAFNKEYVFAILFVAIACVVAI